MSLIQGEAVTVLAPNVECDDLGEPTYGEPEKTPVENVVVEPGSSAELDASRPEGAVIAYTLRFPKSFDSSLKGCEIEVRGDECRVVGEARRYTDSNVPGEWNLIAEVERVEG